MGEFYNVDIRGKHWLERLSSLPAWSAEDEGRILYDSANEQVVSGNASQWIRAGKYGDVPLGTTLLAESDVALVGFSMEIDKDDMVSYMTKGSGAGGEAGGSDKSGGTWTQPNHTHTQITHQHDVGSHLHSIGSHTHSTIAVALTEAQLASHRHPTPGNFFSASGFTLSSGCCNWGTYTYTGYTGSGATHSHGNTGAGVGDTGAPSGDTDSGAGGGDLTGGGASANTWRPEGRNFTRQTRI